MREKERWRPELFRCMQETLRRNRRLRFFLIVLLGIWIVAGTKLVTEKILYRERNLKEAVATVNPGSTTGTVAFVGKLEDGYLTETDQLQLIRFAAGKIGLSVDSEPEAFAEDGRAGYVYRKKAKHADTVIEVIGMQESAGKTAYYLVLTLNLPADDGDAAMYYRNLIAGMSQELGVVKEQISVQITGRFGHGMTTAAKNRLADRILGKLGCKVVCENREEALYTVYGYTRGMNEYICSGEDRINVQLAIYYDEIKDETVVCVASPVITAEPAGTEYSCAMNQ